MTTGTGRTSTGGMTSAAIRGLGPTTAPLGARLLDADTEMRTIMMAITDTIVTRMMTGAIVI
jgi:hypothetical protein